MFSQNFQYSTSLAIITAALHHKSNIDGLIPQPHLRLGVEKPAHCGPQLFHVLSLEVTSFSFRLSAGKVTVPGQGSACAPNPSISDGPVMILRERHFEGKETCGKFLYRNGSRAHDSKQLGRGLAWELLCRRVSL
jgi:hypothetical protein